MKGVKTGTLHKRQKVREFYDQNPGKHDKSKVADIMATKYGGTKESWRSSVRDVTGSMGDKNRAKAISEKYFYNGFEKFHQENFKTEPEPFDEPFIIPSSIKKLSVISDLHSVYLDKDVMLSFLRRTKDKTAVMLNGDLMDSSSITRHLKEHNVVAYEKELEICHQILKGLKQEFTHVYFKEGNHDFWLQRYLLLNAREVFRVRGLELKELLRIGELGVHHIHNLKYWTFGDLDGVHGHEFPGFGLGKFPARALVDKWQTFKHKYSVKVLCGHCHRQDEAVTPKSKTGEYGYGYTVAAMCRKRFSYSPFGGLEQGWAELEIVDGKTEVTLIPYEP